MIDKEKYKNMYQDKVTLCGSNAYEKKYYLNPDFNWITRTDQTGTADRMCIIYSRSRRNLDTGIR